MKKSILLVCLVTLMHAAGNTQTPLQFRDTTVKGPQTFAMVMGISKYKYVRPLTYADKDAELFRSFLQSPGGGNVKEDNIFTLLNDKAVAANFWIKGFQWLRAKNLQKGDRLFIYLAGHGDAIDEDQYFFLGHDCNPGGDKNNYLVAGTIQLYNLKKKIASETAKGVDVFFVMDACRTNELPGGQEGLNFLNTAISEKKVGEIMMLATGAGQESLEDASIGNGHGLFTWYLVDGLSGIADPEQTADNKISFTEIKAYVEKNVPAVAQQRFQRTQEPWFCCNEYGTKVVTQVDSAYLKKWLNEKNRRSRGGNSFDGNIPGFNLPDTALTTLYDLFSKAVKKGNLTGASSAEYLYNQMENKFPNTAYTLDAKTTLATEFVNFAQNKVHEYLSCGLPNSSQKRIKNAEAGNLLEKAMLLISKDEPEFAAALQGRMLLLKAAGQYGSASEAFQYAHAARAIDPNGAYILNWLSQLHAEQKNQDSAVYYAERAVKAAPKWPCALTTLNLARKNKANSPTDPNRVKPLKKIGFGFTAGGGIIQSNPTFSGNRQTGFEGTDAVSTASGNAGVLCYINLGNSTGIRPTVSVQFGNTEVEFQRSTTEPEMAAIKGAELNISIPLLIRLSSKKVTPYLVAGPSLSYLLQQDAGTGNYLAVKKTFILGSAGFGVDFGLAQSGFVLSPELKFNAGFTDMNDEPATSPFGVALKSLKKNSFTLNLYIRKR